MSRIGKKPIAIPNDVKVSIEDTRIVAQKGNVKKELNVFDRVGLSVEENILTISSKGTSKTDKAFWGTYRALANNMLIGLDKGFEKKLEINGVGYRANLQGKTLVLQLGFSHPINYPIPEGIEVLVEKETAITIKGNEKQQVGQIAAEIRSFRPPEPYKGKGVKYSDEHIIRKAGKTASKK